MKILEKLKKKNIIISVGIVGIAILVLTQIFRLSEEAMISNAIVSDNQVCNNTSDFKILRCHGADPIDDGQTSEADIINKFTSSRETVNPSIFVLPYDYISKVCYTKIDDIDDNSNDEILIGGIRVYILPPNENNRRSLLIVPSLIYKKTNTFSFFDEDSDGYKNSYNWCLHVSENLNEPISREDIITLVGGDINNLKNGNYPSYFLGRNLLMIGVRNSSDSNLKIELIKRPDHKEGFLLQSTNTLNRSPIELNLPKTYYCLPKEPDGSGSGGPNGAGCVKPCPDNCSDQ